MVLSYLKLLERRHAATRNKDAEKLLGFAVDGADRMRGMIEGLLQYSRVETQGDLFESVSLDTVVEDVRDDLQVKIEENDAEIIVKDLPCVEGYVNQLRRVFQNLLDNAIEYSGGSPPTIQVTVERDRTEWVVSVADDGIDIDAE